MATLIDERATVNGVAGAVGLVLSVVTVNPAGALSSVQGFKGGTHRGHVWV